MKKHDKYGVVEYNKGYIFAIFMALLLAVSIALGTVVFYAESGQVDSNINTADDGVWASLMAATTVGYGDKYPVTWSGRIPILLTAFAGVCFTGLTAGIVSNVMNKRFDNSITNRQHKLVTDLLFTKIDRLEQHLKVDVSKPYEPDEVIKNCRFAQIGRDDSGLYIVINKVLRTVTTHEELTTAEPHYMAIIEQAVLDNYPKLDKESLEHVQDDSSS